MSTQAAHLLDLNYFKNPLISQHTYGTFATKEVTIRKVNRILHFLSHFVLNPSPDQILIVVKTSVLNDLFNHS